jgi:hydroxymethyl cephem carbamoyltransferase
MKILSLKPGHDGTAALIDSDTQSVEFSYEAEKDSFPRYEAFNPIHFIEVAQRLDIVPDVFAISGWMKWDNPARSPSGTGRNAVGGGYNGFESAFQGTKRLFGKTVRTFTNSHERSHIWSSYGLSPFEQGQPCYVLVYEGGLGDFYLIEQDLNVRHLDKVMIRPGYKYGFLYALADPAYTLPKGQRRMEDAGKLMALSAFGEAGSPSKDEQAIIDLLLDPQQTLVNVGKEDLQHFRYHNIGVEHPEFTRLAKRYSDAIFDRFYRFAKANMTKGYPLLIAGGCGLNCEWNTKWRDCGLFPEVFVPPCTNDTGSAIGTAIDAMREFTGKAKVSWDVYCDRPFVDDKPSMPDVEIRPLDFDEVAHFLAQGNIVAWTQGNCEIGPRALGNRSILASPISAEMLTRLNKIKDREGFRPIAPMCLEEDVERHFDWQGPSPYMLYFQKVTDTRLKAVTHVDGSARVQTVNPQQNARVHKLLRAFRQETGIGVLCNTSLNFKGSGFINRTSDLYQFCKTKGIEGFVFGNSFHTFKW